MQVEITGVTLIRAKQNTLEMEFLDIQGDTVVVESEVEFAYHMTGPDLTAEVSASFSQHTGEIRTRVTHFVMSDRLKGEGWAFGQLTTSTQYRVMNLRRRNEGIAGFGRPMAPSGAQHLNCTFGQLLTTTPIFGRITPDTMIDLFKNLGGGGLEARLMSDLEPVKLVFSVDGGAPVHNIDKAFNHFLQSFEPNVNAMRADEAPANTPTYMLTLTEGMVAKFPGFEGAGIDCFKRHHDFIVVMTVGNDSHEVRVHIPDSYQHLAEQFETLIYEHQAQLSKWKIEQLNRKYAPLLMKFTLGQEDQKNTIRAPLEAALTAVANEYNLTWSEVIGEHGLSYMFQYQINPNAARISFTLGGTITKHTFDIDNVNTSYQQLRAFWETNEHIAKWLVDEQPRSMQVIQVSVAYHGAKTNLPAYFMGAAMDFLRPKKAIIMQVGDPVIDIYKYEITKNHFQD
jgi:hypothetical protein